MKIRILFLSLFLNITIYCIAQKIETINPEALYFKELKLTAQRTAPSEIKLPFSSIKIIDSRFDTSKIGFLPGINIIQDKRNVFRKIRFKGGIVKSLQEYYNDYYKNSFQQNGFELLIVMKRFWVSGVDNRKDKQIELTNSLEVATNLYFKWEYYLGKNNNYLPVKRVDTIIQVSDDLAQYIDEEFNERRLARFKFALKAMIELHDFEKKVEVFDKQPKKTMEEIDNYNAKRNDLVVLKDSILKKGIYLSFDEFKNNSPSIKDYKEEKTRYNIFKSERYLTDAQGNLINNYWGYSDGEDFRYGKFGNDRIFRIGNTFQFFIQINAVAPNNSTPVTTKDKIKVWFPYQIDMESGKIY
jgi:hypothetical protein